MARAVGSTPYAQGPPRRPRWLRAVPLVLLLLLVAEVALIVVVAKAIGVVPTILLLILVSLTGLWLVRREGARAWKALNEALRSGRMPSEQLADGALVLVGGVLLTVPGFITAVVGFFFVLPFTRPVARRFLAALVATRLLGQVTVFTGDGRPPVVPGEVRHDDPAGTNPSDAGPGQPGAPPIIRGEIRPDDEHPR